MSKASACKMKIILLWMRNIMMSTDPIWCYFYLQGLHILLKGYENKTNYILQRTVLELSKTFVVLLLYV